MKAKLKFFNECLNMKMVPTYVSKKVVGWLLHIEVGNDIDWAIMILKKIVKDVNI